MFEYITYLYELFYTTSSFLDGSVAPLIWRQKGGDTKALEKLLEFDKR